MSAAVSTTQPVSSRRNNSPSDSVTMIVRRHLRFGWLTLFAFLTLGLVLETLHGFKVQAYLSLMNETRRLMWTLAHAHGTGLGMVNLAFAFSVNCVPSWSQTARAVASYSLIAASVLMPAGFFLGGVWVYAGDPGLGILLVPVGGILLFVAVLLVALSQNYFQTENRGSRNPESQISNSK
jgi:hypothetical protein